MPYSTLSDIDNIGSLPTWSFGDSPQMADELLALVIAGKRLPHVLLLSGIWQSQYRLLAVYKSS